METQSHNSAIGPDQGIYRKLFEVSVDPMGVAGFDGYFKEINSSLYNSLGVSKEDLLSRPILDFVHPDDRAASQEEFEKVKSGNLSVYFENRYVCQNNSYKWFEWTWVPVEGNHIIMIARDITQQKQSHEHFLETIIDNIPDMIFVKEAKDLRFVRFNRAGEELLGYSRGELIGKNDYDIFPVSQADFFTSKDRSVFSGGILVEIAEEPIETKYNGLRILHTKKIPLYDELGQPEYLVGISEDITEKKLAATVRQKMYQEQVAREEAEKSIIARDEFISIASHELKSPISSLKLQAQMHQRKILKGSADAYDQEKIHQMIDFTVTQADRLDRLVNDMLDVSRIRTGKLSMVYSEFNLFDLIQDVLSRMQSEFAQTKNIPTFTYNSKDVVGQWDYLRIEQVFVNLLTNAIRYGKGSPIEVRLLKKEQSVEFSVHDKGIGIAQDNLEKIFNRFERAVDRNEVSGLGLGLFISKEIVDAHHGEIWAEGEIGIGSSFFVTLPILRQVT